MPENVRTTTKIRVTREAHTVATEVARSQGKTVLDYVSALILGTTSVGSVSSVSVSPVPQESGDTWEPEWREIKHEWCDGSTRVDMADPVWLTKTLDVELACMDCLAAMRDRERQKERQKAKAAKEFAEKLERAYGGESA